MMLIEINAIWIHAFISTISCVILPIVYATLISASISAISSVIFLVIFTPFIDAPIPAIASMIIIIILTSLILTTKFTDSSVTASVVHALFIDAAKGTTA